MTRCQICGEPADVHVTELSSNSRHATHYCGDHVPLEFVATLEQETSRIWSSPDARRTIAEEIAEMVGRSSAEVDRLIDEYVKRLRARG